MIDGNKAGTAGMEESVRSDDSGDEKVESLYAVFGVEEAAYGTIGGEEMTEEREEVQIHKVDMDTAGVAFLERVTREEKITVLRSGQASEEDLANPKILCIEVGGSGRVSENDFDHHGKGSEGLPSAILQAWRNTPCWACGFSNEEMTPDDFLRGTPCEGGVQYDEAVTRAKLVKYINQLDMEGSQEMKSAEFPTLSDVFSGMLLITRDPIEQLHCGVEIFSDIQKKCIDPSGKMPIIPTERIQRWQEFAEAKTENDRQIAKAIKEAAWIKTTSGLKLAYLETQFFGAPGALYEAGAEIAVAFNPKFGPNRIRKFTVAGNGIKVNSVTAELNEREGITEQTKGWGGPGTGTIIGSPREGSKLTLEEVVEIAKKL